ncbi:MAG: hypothetical protein ACKVIH_01060 [Burkholderiales bacterium]
MTDEYPPLSPAQAEPSAAERMHLRNLALARWQNEGEPDGAHLPPTQSDAAQCNQPADSTEWVQLRIRVIALENLVIALLAEASGQQLALAREMAAYISPREGYTPHPLTLRAAHEMRSLVDRADRFLPTPAS